MIWRAVKIDQLGLCFTALLNLYYFWEVCNFNGLNIGVNWNTSAQDSGDVNLHKIIPENHKLRHTLFNAEYYMIKIFVLLSYHVPSTTAVYPGVFLHLLEQIPGFQPRFTLNQNMHRISRLSMMHRHNVPIHFVLQISHVQQSASQTWMVEHSKEQPEPLKHQKNYQMHWNVPCKTS